MDQQQALAAGTGARHSQREAVGTDPRTGLAQLTGTRKKLALAVGTGAVVIAGIGFAGSYGAVVDLAVAKGFGGFAHVLPIGIDAGIAVLLALDLLLTSIRIPFPVLRHVAWLLTVATIAFNAAAAWPDLIAVGMHAAMPMLFVVVVEAVRHAVGRLADITADKHMDGVRMWRWLLSPTATLRLWCRMKLWELRSYDQTVRLEQDRLIYQARLQARFGRGWRRKAPVEAVLPLRLAKLGVPLVETAPAGLAAAGITLEWPSAPRSVPTDVPELPASEEQVLAAREVIGAPSPKAVLAAGKPRQEVRMRIPVRDTTASEETGQTEAGQAEEPTAEPAVKAAREEPDTQAADRDSESAEPQVTPVSPEPKSPLAARNARASEEAAKRYAVYSEGWSQAQKDTPEITFSEFAEQLGVSTRTLRRALVDKVDV
ncbi:DUF2637 domain-containing protein [Streptomyces purpureus]|uniref:DUF2637 domain-containing protein n=1 Tax=Streptomyces purpureus TaxID=1951 RepID=UPI00035C82C7|nr:DUF2637 domain-containing protein [Streptomyces purpureus]